MIARKQQHQALKNDLETVRIAAEISTQRSYSDLIITARHELTKYFGFEGFGILFKDTKTNELFSYERDFT